MPTCPDGHDSTATDYCDTCGLVLGARQAAPEPGPPPVAPAAAPDAAPAAGPAAASAAGSALPPCAGCGAAREGRFCEVCGLDNDLPAPVEAPSGALASGHTGAPAWVALVRADRDWFEQVRRRDGPDAASLEFPRYCPERRFELTGDQVAIGRRSRSRGTDPDIDLGGPPTDPGVSAQHALLVARPDGGWDVVDLGSTNGTAVGESIDPIPPNVPVGLTDGDRIRLGAWTTITIGTPDR